MIRFVVAINEDGNDKFEEYLKPSLKILDQTKFTLHLVYNKDASGIFSKYNLIVSGLNIEDEDVVVFIHSDVRILDPLFIEKIQTVFSKRPEVGLIGVI